MKQKSFMPYWIALTLVLVGVFINSYNTIQKKEGFFLDEIFTFYNANHPYTTMGGTLSLLIDGIIWERINNSQEDKIQILQYEDVKSSLTMSNGKELNLFSVYASQTLEDSHPPLYYGIIHITSWISRCTSIKAIGFGINVFCLLCTCVVLFLFVQRLILKPVCGLLAATYYGFSIEFLNSVVFMRMYSMFAFWVTLLAYLYFILHSSNYNKRFVKYICAIQLAAMFTHYFIMCFIFPLFLFTINKLKNNEYRRHYIKCHVIIGLTFCFLWPQFIIQLSKGLVLRTATGHIGLSSRFCGYISNIIDSLFVGSYIYFYVFIFLSIILIWNQVKKKDFSLAKISIDTFTYKPIRVILFSSLFFFVLMVLISPWVAFRYVTPIMPLLSAFIVIALMKIINSFIKREIIQVLVIITITFYVSFVLAPNITPLHLYNSDDRRAFVSMYKKYSAIVVGEEKLDVLGNFSHPQYVILKTNQIKELNNYQSNNCVVYLNKNCGKECKDSVLLSFANFSKINYSSDYFDIYVPRDSMYSHE